MYRRNSTCFVFCAKAFVHFLHMLVVRLMVEQVDAGSIFPLEMVAHSARGDA